MAACPRISLPLILLLLFQITGCGSLPSRTPTATPLPTPDPQVTLKRAVTQLLELKSARFSLEHKKGSTLLFPGVEMRKASGVVEIPDRFRLKVEGESTFLNSYVELNVIAIDDRAYMTDPITGKWQEVKAESLPVSLSNLGRTLADIIESVDEPDLAGSEKLNGRNAYRVTGRVQSEDLAGLVPGAGQGFDVELELWLDQVDGLPRQVLITGKVVPTDIPDVVRVLTLDGFNLPVDISPPK